MMKRFYIFPLVISLMLINFSIRTFAQATMPDSQQEEPSAVEKARSYPPTSIEWERETYIFGQTKAGHKRVGTFQFVNKGQKNAHVVKVESFCDCIDFKWPENGIPPGGRGIINFSFNTDSLEGEVYEGVAVYMNTESTVDILYVNAPIYQGTYVYFPAQPGYMLKAKQLPQTTIEWSETEFDFGNVLEGRTKSHTFSFKNTGDVPVVITKLKPSCGCVVPEWEDKAILPGEKGEVTVQFDSYGKSGKQRKAIILHYNSDPSPLSLYIYADVVYELPESPQEAPAERDISTPETPENSPEQEDEDNGE